MRAEPQRKSDNKFTNEKRALQMGFRRAKEMTTISNPSEKEPLACDVYLCKYNIQYTAAEQK